jgi:hypothetical protein
MGFGYESDRRHVLDGTCIAMTYQVEQRYVRYVDMLGGIEGTARVRVLPKVYKTWQGAEKAAQRLRYVVSPDGRTRVCSSTAKVIEKAGDR